MTTASPGVAEGTASLAAVLSLADGASISEMPDGGLAVNWQARAVPLGAPPAGVREALLRIGSANDDVDSLAARVLEADGWAGVARLHALLDQLARWRLLLRRVRDAEATIATLVPISRGFYYPDQPIRADRRYQLSRFALLRRAGDDIVLESPRAHGRILLPNPRAMLAIHALGRPCSLADLANTAQALPPRVLHALLTLLCNAALADEVDDTGASRETLDPDLAAWEFHDLLFHSRSRQGRHDHPAGAVPLAGDQEPPPAIKPPMAEEGIDLAIPSPSLGHDGPGFDAVLAARRSVRDYGRAPISRVQLSEFLYRTGRVIATRPSKLPGQATVTFETTQRPYPSAGALHELEFYVAVARAQDLESGFYHYHPVRHRLEPLNAAAADVAALLSDASHGTTIPIEQLQILIVIAARFRRATWKYRSMAYAAILKNVGVAYQTMYMVATAMGLAPCAIGSGDSDRLSRLIGAETHVESSVGEFLLGSRA